MTQSLTWKLPPITQPGQFHHLHRVVVINTHTRFAVEGHYTRDAAFRAARVLNQHNEDNGHPAHLGVELLPTHLHNMPPSHWH